MGGLRRDIPKAVQEAVPLCALDCLERFIWSNFPSPTCLARGDIDCICTQRSSTGLTLGEAAVQCLLSTCVQVDDADLHVYNICSGIANAFPNTHSALTVTVMITPNISKTPIPVSTSSSPTAHSTSSISSHSIPTTEGIATSQTIATSMVSTLPARSVRSTAEASVSTGTPSQLPSFTTKPTVSLERGQIIGLSVGGAAVGALLLGLVIFFLARRRRYNQHEREESHHFEIGGTMAEPKRSVVVTTSLVDTGPRTPIGAYNRPIVDQLPPLPKVHISKTQNSSPGANGHRRQFSADDTSSVRSPLTPISQTSSSHLLPQSSQNTDGALSNPAIGLKERQSDTERNDSEEDLRPRQSLRWEQSMVPGTTIPYSNAPMDTSRLSPSQDSFKWSRSPDGTSGRSPQCGRYLSPCHTPLYSVPASSLCSHAESPKAHLSLSPKSLDGCEHESQTSGIQQPSCTHCCSHSSDDGRLAFSNVPFRTQRSYSLDSASITSFETAGSDAEREQQCTQVLPNLSPIKEAPSPDLFQEGLFRSKHGPTPTTAVGKSGDLRTHIRPVVNHSIPLLRGMHSRSIKRSQNSNLLVKRRGESFAGQMENGIAVSSACPPSTQVSKCGLPSNPRSATRPQPHWGRQVQLLRDDQWLSSAPSPGPRRMTPTRDGANLVLHFD
ncbi:hypothetical protein VTO42DRAFT_7746 [Malbranchea cinnamomea]